MLRKQRVESKSKHKVASFTRKEMTLFIDTRSKEIGALKYSKEKSIKAKNTLGDIPNDKRA